MELAQAIRRNLRWESNGATFSLASLEGVGLLKVIFFWKKIRLGLLRNPNLKVFFRKQITFKRPRPSGEDGDHLASAEEP